MAPSADPTKNKWSIEASSETTPLLGAPESGGPVIHDHGTNGHINTKAATPFNWQAAQDYRDEPEGKSMPYVQIVCICYASLAEPIAYFGIFPFINEMLALNGHLREEDVGFWAGAIESLFSVVQMLLMIFYGRMADRLGRKPVLVFSLVGVSLATALFGMATTLGQMILFRCIAGCFAGAVVTMRTMISENTDKTTQGKAFAWYMFSRNLGILLGPLIGGGLAEPAKQFPGTFGHIQFFNDYPYALSTFATGAFCMTTALGAALFLKETLKRKETGGAEPEPPLSTLQILRSPGVPAVLWIFGHTTLLGLAYTAIFPVVMYTSIGKGGFSFGPAIKSYILALAGASQALWMLVAFPPLQRRLGTGTLLRICAVAWTVFMTFYPILNELLRHGWKTTFWVLGPITQVLGSGIGMSFACVQLCLNDISPAPNVLGTLNALALTMNSGLRAIAPALFTAVYAFGVKSQWADGHLVWVVLIVVAAGLIVALRSLPEEAEGRPDYQKVKSTEPTPFSRNRDTEGQSS